MVQSIIMMFLKVAIQGSMERQEMHTSSVETKHHVIIHLSVSEQNENVKSVIHHKIMKDCHYNTFKANLAL